MKRAMTLKTRFILTSYCSIVISVFFDLHCKLCSSGKSVPEICYTGQSGSSPAEK